MIERVKELRKLKKMTQKEFGQKIGVTGDSISSIEKGKRNLTERNISLICERFNVNEEWLRFGTGDIFCDNEKNIIDTLAEKYNLDSTIKACIEVLIGLEPDEIKVLSKYIKEVALKYSSQNTQEEDIEEESEVFNNQALTDEEIEQELAAYRAELLAEQKGRTSSASENINLRKKA